MKSRTRTPGGGRRPRRRGSRAGSRPRRRARPARPRRCPSTSGSNLVPARDVVVGAGADDPERDAPDRDAQDEVPVAAAPHPAHARSARSHAAIASSSISPYMWTVSGPRSSVPVCGEGIEARSHGATFCPRGATPARWAPDQDVDRRVGGQPCSTSSTAKCRSMSCRPASATASPGVKPARIELLGAPAARRARSRSPRQHELPQQSSLLGIRAQGAQRISPGRGISVESARELERLRLGQLALEAQGEPAVHQRRTLPADQDRLARGSRARRSKYGSTCAGALDPESRLRRRPGRRSTVVRPATSFFMTPRPRARGTPRAAPGRPSARSDDRLRRVADHEQVHAAGAAGPAARAGSRRAARGLGAWQRVAEPACLRALGRRRERVDALDGRAAEVEEAQDRAARRRDGEARSRARRRGRPARPRAAATGTAGAARAARRTRGARSGVAGHVELPAELEQPQLERSRLAPALPQPLERAREPRLHRPEANAEHRRRLLLGELEEVAARDRVAVLVRQTLDRVEQPRAALAREQQPPRGTGPRPPGGPRRRAQAERGSRRPAERRRFRASLATIRSSHGLSGAPRRKRPSARYALTKPSCAASSASAAFPPSR